MNKETFRRLCMIAALLPAALVVPSASATIFFIDEFSVDLNGSLLFNDPFSDGIPPPSAPNFQNGSPASYIVALGATIPNERESGGKLELNPLEGAPSQTPDGRPSFIQGIRLQTPTNPVNPIALGESDTFSVSGVFDLINPGAPSEAYRIGLTDRVGPQGPSDTTNDVLRLAVDRAFSGPLAGQVVITLFDLDFETDTVDILGRVPVDLTGNPDQIRLTLSKTDATSTSITPSFAYLKDGAELSSGILPTQSVPEIFTGESFTRAEFTSFVLDEPDLAQVARLTTGSPVSIGQLVDTPATPFNLEFDYLFETVTGELTISLGSFVLGSIPAPSTLQSAFSMASFLIDGPLLSQNDVLLQFLLDGPTGSTVLLDNIVFPGLANGGFQTGNLTAWTVTTTGTGSVGVVTLQVPEPTTMVLLGMGLIGLGFARRRRPV